jgi:hypothetical protein
MRINGRETPPAGASELSSQRAGGQGLPAAAGGDGDGAALAERVVRR